MVSRNHGFDLNPCSPWAEDWVANFFVASYQCVKAPQKSEGVLADILENEYLLKFLKSYTAKKKKLVLFDSLYIDLETG